MKSCSLDLCLSPMASTLQFCRRDSPVGGHSSAMRSKDINAFYNGRLREYDLVEIQIREIIEMARKDRDQETPLELAPARNERPLGCSVKRSVKRFLEKRKKRNKSFIPNSYTYTSTSSSSSSSSSSSHRF